MGRAPGCDQAADMALKENDEAGSVIMMLFIMVALFGLLAFAFLRGTNSNIGWIKTEQSKANSTKNADCMNSTNMALKRLEARGCGNLVSYAADGSNSNAGAPADGSCSLYHPNGGGIKVCGASPFCNLTKLAVGQACNDEIVYVGVSPAGGRMYTSRCDAGMIWDGASCTGSRSYFNWGVMGESTNGNSSDGRLNTGLMVALGPTYEGAVFCKSLVIGGYTDWYLPSDNEITVLQTNKTSLGVEPTGYTYYQTSNEDGGYNFKLYSFGGSGGFIPYPAKNRYDAVRCVRRD